MTTTPRNQIPLQYDIVDAGKRVSQPWAFWLQTFQNSLPPAGSGYVIDGSAGTSGPMTLFWGPDTGKGMAQAGYIYFSTDTGKIWIANGSTWVLESPAFTGDVLKPAGSTVTTLNNVNPYPGTWGSAGTTPIITVNAKGLITYVTSTPTTASAAGVEGSIQLNHLGALGNSPDLYFDYSLDILQVPDTHVTGQITFVDPIPTRTNLLPVQTGKAGMVLATNGTDVFWESPGPYEFIWHYGDASPSPLMTIPAGKAVLSCQVVVLQAMNGTGAALSVGSTASTYTDVMNITDNLPSSLSTWSVEPNTVFGVNTGIFLSITPGAGATAGYGIITITVQQ